MDGTRRFEIAPLPGGRRARVCERELGVSGPLAQVLVRRGLADPERARAFLAADEEHPPAAFAASRRRSRRSSPTSRAARGSRCTATTTSTAICSTAVLVRALRALGANVDWYLPDRAGDGYGLNAAPCGGWRSAARACW